MHYLYLLARQHHPLTAILTYLAAALVIGGGVAAAYGDTHTAETLTALGMLVGALVTKRPGDTNPRELGELLTQVEIAAAKRHGGID